MRPARHPNCDEFDRRMEALPLRTLCALCSWEYVGTALEGRQEAIQHRLQAHPELTAKRHRPGRHLNSFRQPTLNKQEWFEVYAERDKRAKLLGIDLSEAAV